MKRADYTDGAQPGRLRGAIVPMLIALGGMVALSVIVYFLNIPDPSILLMTGLTIFTAVLGFEAGAVSAAVAVAYAFFFYSENHDFITFSALSLQNISVLALCAVACTLVIGNLKQRQSAAARKLEEMNRLKPAESRAPEEAPLTDALTGVRNRFGLRQDYNRFENRYVHVMMMDLDIFRKVNDTYGHAVGDFILKKAGLLLSEAFGANSCYRYGGDEFLVVCIDMDEAIFRDKLNTLKQGMNGIYLNDKHLPARFSAGYVYGDCERSYDLRLMIHQADHFLGQAKGRGRDCFVGGAFSRGEAEAIEHSARDGERRPLSLNDLFPV